MAPTGLDIKRNIVQLAQLKGMKQSDFLDVGIGSTTVKNVFRMTEEKTPDLDTVNKFAEKLGVETYKLYMTGNEEKTNNPEKEEFLHLVDLTFDRIPAANRKILLAMYKAFVSEQ